jgi:hypothetical protein
MRTWPCSTRSSQCEREIEGSSITISLPACEPIAQVVPVDAYRTAAAGPSCLRNEPAHRGLRGIERLGAQRSGCQRTEIDLFVVDRGHLPDLYPR